MPEPVEVDVPSAVAVYLDERARLGKDRYGTRLRTGNGRDGLRDLMEELADGLQYVAALIIERDGRLPAGDTARQALPRV
jgi:hypothetical protein